MRSVIYRYQFNPDVPMEEVESSIVLALFAAEALHGECEVQLVAPHYFDADRRACIVDATTPAGGDFNRVLFGFLRREFGRQSFRVEGVDGASHAPATAA